MGNRDRAKREVRRQKKSAKKRIEPTPNVLDVPREVEVIKKGKAAKERESF